MRSSRLLVLAAMLTACGSSSVQTDAGALADSAASDAASNDASNNTSDAASDAASNDASNAVESTRPPAPGPTHAPTGAGATVFAVSKLYIGDIDPDGTPDPMHGWEHYGYDLDGLVTTSTSPLGCQPRANALQRNFTDAPGGVDNSFGKNILPIILGISSAASANANAAIQNGDGTPLIFELRALDASADLNPVDARLYRGARLGVAPHFDGTDQWPVFDDDLTTAGDLSSARLHIADSYVTNNTWVALAGAGSPSFGFALRLDNFALPLPIYRFIVAGQLDASRQNVSHGMIAGVIHLDELRAEFTRLMAGFDPTYCDPTNATLQSILTQLDQAADVLADGTNDPTRMCDAISLGVGFDAAVVQLHGSIPSVAPTDPCMQ